MSTALVSNKFSQVPPKISNEKKICHHWLVTAWNLQTIKAFVTLKLSQYRKGGCTFSSTWSEPVVVCSDCSRLWIALCLCRNCARQSYLPKLCRSTAPRARSLILQWKTSNVFWNSQLSDDRQGLELGLKLELCCLTNELQSFYLLPNPRINCVGFEFFLGQLKMPKLRIEPQVNWFQSSSPESRLLIAAYISSQYSLIYSKQYITCYVTLKYM